jgi:hypothetical protein
VVSVIADDARLQVADRFARRLDDSPYFGNYERWTVPWQPWPEACGEIVSTKVKSNELAHSLDRLIHAPRTRDDSRGEGTHSQ